MPADLPTNFKVILPPKNEAGPSIWYENMCYGIYDPPCRNPQPSEQAITDGAGNVIMDPGAVEPCTDAEIREWLYGLTPTSTWKSIKDKVHSFEKCEGCAPVYEATVKKQSGIYTINIPEAPDYVKFCRGIDGLDIANCNYTKWDGKLNWVNNNRWSIQDPNYKHIGGLVVSSSTYETCVTFSPNGDKGYYILSLTRGRGTMWIGYKYDGDSPAGIYFRDSGCLPFTSLTVS